jgi:hypothetical protein
MGTVADPDNFFNSSQLRNRFCNRIQYQLLKRLPKAVLELPHIHQENGLLPESREFVPEFNFCRRRLDAGSRIDTSLKSKEENLREKGGKEKSKKMMERIDENQAPNARQRQQGEDLPPCLLGYFLY